MRKISFAKAINEALHQIITEDKEAFLIGQGVTSPWYVGSTTVGLIDKFGPKKIIDTPTSENCITGVTLGSALAGMHPIICFPRMDFMYLAMDQIANHIANWHYMFGGQLNAPMVIWAIINRGGEQAAQHSQALQAVFTHIPGVKVVMPSTPYDAKGLLISSLQDGNPVVYIDDRWLYEQEGEVPDEYYSVPIGKGVLRNDGMDATVVATSYMVHEALKAAEELAREGVHVDLMDLRSVKPLDEEMLFTSVKKTKRLVVVDGGWKNCGFAAEICARIAETSIFKLLEMPIVRVTLPDTPAPASQVLEKVYYPTVGSIISAVKRVLRK